MSIYFPPHPFDSSDFELSISEKAVFWDPHGTGRPPEGITCVGELLCFLETSRVSYTDTALERRLVQSGTIKSYDVFVVFNL